MTRQVRQQGRWALVVAVAAFGAVACGPATLRYTVRVESQPSGAKVYDPRTDEVIGETPFEVPVEYVRTSVFPLGSGTYVRKQTSFDQYTPQDPLSKEPRELVLESNDSVRVLVVKDGFKRLDQTIDWWFSEVDGQVIKKRVYLEPMGEQLGASDDVYR